MEFDADNIDEKEDYSVARAPEWSTTVDSDMFFLTLYRPLTLLDA